MKRTQSIKGEDSSYATWTDEDDAFLRSVGISDQKKKQDLTKKPLFKCWLEDWEIDCQTKKNSINKAKFERKYIGIKFYDVDNEGRILECVRVKFMKEHGYTIECNIINDDEEDDEDSFTIKVVIE